jgi:hypothetical protein
MNQRIQYPLTEEAKATARMLVKGWNTGKLPQKFWHLTVDNINSQSW